MGFQAYCCLSLFSPLRSTSASSQRWRCVTSYLPALICAMLQPHKTSISFQLIAFPSSVSLAAISLHKFPSSCSYFFVCILSLSLSLLLSLYISVNFLSQGLILGAASVLVNGGQLIFYGVGPLVLQLQYLLRSIHCPFIYSTLLPSSS